MKIGVLGGTFDPVHLGHLMMSREAKVSLDLHEVILVPAGQPLLKPTHPITPAEHRLQMLWLAVADKPNYTVSTMELERPGPSYTVDTIAQLREHYGNEDEIFFILGWDSLAQFAAWREPSRIIGMCYLVAIPRQGCPRPDLEVLEESVPNISQRVIFLEKPLVDISASAVRERAARGMSLRRFVPGAVAEYIKQHKLYSI
jgi:nicotinate-nucleotide adenylyltransferase